MVTIDAPLEAQTAVFEASPNAYLLLTPDLRVADVNTAHSILSGESRESVLGKHILEAFPVKNKGDEERLLESFQTVLDTGLPHTLHIFHYPLRQGSDSGANWEDRYWHINNAPIQDKEGRVVLILNHVADLTQLFQPEDSLAHFPPAARVQPAQLAEAMNTVQSERRYLRSLMEQAPGFVAVGRGPTHVFELANKAYYQLVGHRDILGKPVREALPELQGQGFYELLDQVYGSGEAFVGRAMPIQIQQEPGGEMIERYIDFIYQPIFADAGEVSGIFVQGHDVTEAHELSRELSHQASHDALTGLYNRREFEQRLAAALQVVAEAGVHSVLYLDLDQFKLVNDTCGHHAGDEFLRLVSLVLDARVRPGDTLARLGGDEFGLLLEGCPGPTAERIADELREAIAELEFIWQGRVFGGSISVGLVSVNDESMNLNQILSTADSACFLAKEKGRNRVQVYRREDDELLSHWRDMDVAGRLRAALKEDRFELHWQKIQALKPGTEPANYFEILLRLRHENGELVPPLAFIPAAERYGLMPVLDRHVISRAFAYLATNEENGQPSVCLSVNLSGTTLNDDGFAPFVEDLLKSIPIRASQVCFEITETAAVSNLASTARAMERLKKNGFRFALDDFGSGMSSLGYLRSLPVDYLKIDGVFIRNILEDPVDAAMVQAIAQIAKVMGIQTVAEYVENESVRNLLVEFGVDFGQGYGIHIPEPVSQGE